MAMAPGRACRFNGCTAIIHSGSYCDKHKTQGRRSYDKALDERRGSARQRGYDSRWEHFRRWFLQQPGNQLCARCTEHGRTTWADLVHHIKPVRERPDLRLHPDNCMPVCNRCHKIIHLEINGKGI